MRAQDCRGTMIIRIRMHMGSHVMFALKKRSRVSTSFFMRIITKVSGKIEGLSDKTLKLYHMYLDDFFILSFILYQNEKTFPQKLLTRKLRTFDKYFARLQIKSNL